MFILAIEDKALAATITTASSMNANFPIGQLNRKLINATARTATSTTTLAIKINLVAGSTFDYWGIINHNLSSANGTARLQVYTLDSRLVEVYDSTALSIDAFSSALPHVTHGWICTAQTDLFLTVTLTDTSLSYIDVGAVYVGTRYVPDSNIEFGLRMLADDPFTVKVEAENGYAGYISKQKQRNAAMSLKLQPHADGREWFEVMLKMGIHGWVMFQYDEDNYLNGYFTFLATLQKLSPLVFPYANRNDFNINVIEQL